MVATAHPAPSLLAVTLTHEYFGGDFTEFAVTPLPTTASAGRRLGLRLLRSEDGLILCVAPDALARLDAADYQSALADTTWCWQLTPHAADFAAYTAVDFTGNTQCLIFTSPAKGTKGGPLTVAATASARDVWTRQSWRFDYRPARPIKAGTLLRLETNLGVALRTVTVTDPQLVRIDTSDAGSGLYQLVQGTRVLTKWFADERPFPPASAGAMLVLPGKLLAAAFARSVGARASAAVPPVYTAGYAARSVIWRYHFFNTQVDEMLSIVPFTDDGLVVAKPVRKSPLAKKSPPGKTGSASSGLFEPFTDAALPDARSFAAVKPLKLARLPAQRFALNNGATTLYAPLPLAGLAFARSDTTTALCSDIFVYL